MLDNFLSYINQQFSFTSETSILVAVSGGVDSMVLLHLLQQTDLKIYVAHVNHSTRDGASDVDALFVKDYCLHHKITFYQKTLDYNMLSKGNFQQNARTERYIFFDNVMKSNHLDFLATAHHMEDRWETFLMHLNRKSGIKGLTSLRVNSKKTIRPLLKFSKNEILFYAHSQGINFREDLSNKENRYLRNAIRNRVSPVLEDIMPNIIVNANNSINRLTELSNMLDELISSNNFISSHPYSDYITIDLPKIKSFSTARTLLYHIISRFGFTDSDTKDILKAHLSGSLFYSESHEGLYDRGNIILRKKQEQIQNHLLINQAGVFTLQDGRNVCINSSFQGKVDLSLNYPLPFMLRSIQPGDTFRPKSLKGKTKKVKKYLTDLKLDRFSKERVLVVVSNGEILDIII